MKGWLHMERSRVRKERFTCMVCTKKYLTGSILIYVGKRPREPTQWGFCPPHQRMKDRNLIALVEVDPTKSIRSGTTIMVPENAHRTGVVVYLSRTIFSSMFRGDPPDNGIAFVPPEVVAMLQKLKGGTQH